MKRIAALLCVFLSACAPANPFQDLKQMHEIAGGDASIENISISPDGSKMLTGSTVGSDRQLYDLAAFAPVAGFQTYGLKATQGSTWERDSQSFLTTASPTGFTRWNVQSGLSQTVYANGKLNDVSLSADGTRVATIEDGRALAVFDSGNGARLWTIPVKGYVTSVRANPSLDSFAVQITVLNATLINFKDGKQLASINGATGNAFSKDGTIWAVGDTRGIHLYDAVTGQKKQDFIRGAYASAIAFSPDNRLIAVTTNTTNQLLNATTGDEVWKESRVEGGVIRSGYRFVEFTPDGKYLMLIKPGTGCR